MTSASMTFGRPIRVVLSQLGQWFAGMSAALAERLQQFDGWLANTQPMEANTPEEVLAWAQRIEATQPGFAADLRSAALRALDEASQH
jgi:hypothetical protein